MTFENVSKGAVVVESVSGRGVGGVVEPARMSFRVWEGAWRPAASKPCPVEIPGGGSGGIELYLSGQDEDSGATGIEVLVKTDKGTQLVTCSIRSREGLLASPASLDVGVVAPGAPQRFRFHVTSLERGDLVVQGEELKLRVSRLPSFDERYQWLVQGLIGHERFAKEGGSFGKWLHMSQQGTHRANVVSLTARMAGMIRVHEGESLLIGLVGLKDQGFARIEFRSGYPDLLEKHPRVTLVDPSLPMSQYLSWEFVPVAPGRLHCEVTLDRRSPKGRYAAKVQFRFPDVKQVLEVPLLAIKR